MSTSPSAQWSATLASETETVRLGRVLAELLQPGDVLGLVGDLGAGKTRLVRAMAEALDVPFDEVHSPTFGLIHEYRGRKHLRHCDAYRLHSAAEFVDLGLDELFTLDAITIIEWSNLVENELPRRRLQLTLQPTSEQSRSLSATAFGASAMRTLEQLKRRWSETQCPDDSAS